MVTVATLSVLVPLVGAFIVTGMLRYSRRLSLWTSRIFLFIGLTCTTVVVLNLGGFRIAELSRSLTIHTGVGLPPLSIDLLVSSGSGIIGIIIYVIALLTLHRVLGDGSGKRLPLILSLITASLGLIYATDLFNSFVFLEIGSIVCIGLAASSRGKHPWEAAVKLALVSGLVTILFLVAIAVVYRVTGELTFQAAAMLSGVPAIAVTVLFLTIIMTEAKAFPLSGWGVDFYQGIGSSFAALYSGTWSLAILVWAARIMPTVLTWDDFSVPLIIGTAGLVAGQFPGLRQADFSRLLGYSSTVFGSLLLIVGSTVFDENTILILVVLIFGGQALAKAGLFLLLDDTLSRSTWRRIGSRWRWVFTFALIGLPPFPVFWGKYELLKTLVKLGPHLVPLVIAGLFFEAVYLLRMWSKGIHDEEEGTGLWGNRGLTLFILAAGYLGFRFTAQEILFSFPNVLPHSMSWIFFLMGAIGGVLVLPGLIHVWPFGKGHGFWLLFAGAATVGIVCAATPLSLYLSWEISAFALVLAVGRSSFRTVSSVLWYSVFAMISGYLILAGVIFGNGNLSGFGTLTAFIPLIVGVMIKLGQFGLHLWLIRAYRSAPGTVTAFMGGVSTKAAVYVLILGLLGFIHTHGTAVTLGSILLWTGAITALGGAVCASFSGTPKKLLAFSSVSQLGYVLIGLGLFNPLGWTAALYHTVNHFLFKTVLFLGVAGVVYRTGVRHFNDLGGLIKRMPFTFVFTLVSVIAYAGVPPLSGFGAKWLLYQGLIDSGNVWVATVAMFASVVSFLYSFRLLHSVFLGQPPRRFSSVREAPLTLLVPQALLVIGIMVLSFRPTLLLERIIPEIGTLFPWPEAGRSFVIDGATVIGPFGGWNATAVGAMVMSVFGLVFIFFWLSGPKPKHVRQLDIGFAGEVPPPPEEIQYSHNFFRHYGRAISFIPTSPAERIFRAAVSGIHGIGDICRIWITGDGRTYLLHILAFAAVLFAFLKAGL